jgi:hypothetical protein
MDLWNRLTHRMAEPVPPPSLHLERDPDLDAMHQEQHDLINRTGYARARIRDSWNERIRESWRPFTHGTR